MAGNDAYDSMLRYLQPHAYDGDEFKEINGTLQPAEAMHSTIDNMLPVKRLQCWRLESKQAWVFGYLTGHNLVHQQLRREHIPDALASQREKLPLPRHITYWRAQKHLID